MKINEHEVTKKMLSKIRENKLILEGDVSDGAVELSDVELKDEEEKFRNTVSPRVVFNSFKVYPKVNNVVFSGVFDILGGLEWQFTLEDINGLYITVNNLIVSEETMLTLKKLKGYYDNWSLEWAKKISTEYRSNE